MVECGIPYKEILKKCNQNGIDFSKVNYCLVTHAHSDHIKSANEISKRGINVCATAKTLEIGAVNGQIMEIEKPNKITNGLYVMPFLVDHDIEGACGFVIKTPNETVIFINDCKKWNTNLINFKPDYVFIECNYNHKMVYAQLNELKKELKECILEEQDKKEHNIKIKQHERNINAHMSLHGTLIGLSKLNLRYCKSIMLMHLSDRYANEYLMKNEVQKQTGIRTYCCLKAGGIH